MPSWITRASLLLGVALAPAALVTSSSSNCNILYGSFQIKYPGGTSNTAWFDKGAGLGARYQIICDTDQFDNKATFYFEYCGPSTTFAVYCQSCYYDKDLGTHVDFEVGTQFDPIGGDIAYPAWYPFALSQVLPNTVYRRNIESALWTMDANNVVTPVLLDSTGGSSGAQILNAMITDDCNNGKSDAEISWGPGGVSSGGNYILFVQSSSKPGPPGPPTDSSPFLCTA